MATLRGRVVSISTGAAANAQNPEFANVGVAIGYQQPDGTHAYPSNGGAQTTIAVPLTAITQHEINLGDLVEVNIQRVG